ncbi:hypothetical protein H312_02380 [Anncaliia algerae PRA339]|uniref:ISXO2-like transposase domain-containing protein n=1 Tax=Anncaliia algerae PRA339 TaxID=1288291 RepID=A0A059EZ81_9MICR|nr:hypothetical protein H312_02380 [Anncaliia algerae PRA339]
MFTPNTFENFIIRADRKELIIYLMELNFLKKENICKECKVYTKFYSHKRSFDNYAWRCMNKKCRKYKAYFNIRTDSFFEGIKIHFKDILRVILKYACSLQSFMIKKSLDISGNTVDKIIKKLIHKIPEQDFRNNKLGGPGFIVQIDETMMNYKCKSHRGRSPENKSDALCIIEFRDKITRVYCTLIENKKAETIIPIICNQVASGSKIWTDEHKSYSSLSKNGFIHESICHKYEFINSQTGVNTQAVESLNNAMKWLIKKKKGIKTEKRKSFLKEFCFLFNNRHDLFHAVLKLLKVN